MAIDTAAKRFSMIGLGSPVPSLLPPPDASIDDEDRAALIFLYGGYALNPPPVESIPGPQSHSVYLMALLADSKGAIKGELDCWPSEIVYDIDELTQVKFPVARTDEKFREDLLRFGNRILIQTTASLPFWPGVIASPREWEDWGVLVTAVDARYLFKHRRTAWLRQFENAQISTIFESLIDESNAVRPLNVIKGTIEAGSDTYTMEYNSQTLFDVFNELVELLGADAWDVMGSESGGQINFAVNLYQRKGKTLINPKLENGRNGNIMAVTFREISEITNAWQLAGKGERWDEDARPFSFRADEDSINAYGYRESSIVIEDATTEETLESIGDNLLAKTAEPYATLGLSLANKAPATYEQYDLGDTIPITLSDYGFSGFDGSLRILARTYRPDANECELFVRQVA